MMVERGTKASDWVVKPALVCDLDGTVRFNKDDPEGFINRPEEVALYPGVEEMLWEWRDRGHLIFGVSNQGGVAFGHKTMRDVYETDAAMLRLFGRNPFHGLRSCPYHPDGTVEPYCHRSLLRKPDIGMLVDCEEHAFDAGYFVDWDNSLMVGDRPEDEECARRAGIAFRWADEFFGRAS